MTFDKRDQFADAITGVACELGVGEGGYSELLLIRSKLERLYSIDEWASRGHNTSQYLRVLDRLSRFGERSRVVRSKFADVVDLFPNESFDCIYVDGYADRGNCGGETFSQWWPKVKIGGLLAGHDYHSKWSRNKRAVDRFAGERGLELGVTRDDRYPSWYVWKK